MALQVTLKVDPASPDVVKIGSDQGLYSSRTFAFGGTLGRVIDNAMTPPGTGVTYYYPHQHYITTGYQWTPSLAQVTPVSFARACKVTAASLQITSAGAGSQLNVAIFAADSTGQPGAKVADMLRFDTTVAAVRTATVVSPTTVLAAATPYFLLTWCYSTSGFPVALSRSASYMPYQWRLPDFPTHTNFYNPGIFGMVEATQSWSTTMTAPSTIAATYPALNAVLNTNYTTAPLIWWGLVNV